MMADMYIRCEGSYKTKEVIIFKDQVRCLDARWLEVIDECTPGFEANVGQG